MNSLQPDGSDDAVKMILTMKFIDEYTYDVPSEPQYSDQELAENLELLRQFLGDLTSSEEVTKLALKKCKLNLEDALIMLTNPESTADLEEEVRRE